MCCSHNQISHLDKFQYIHLSIQEGLLRCSDAFLFHFTYTHNDRDMDLEKIWFFYLAGYTIPYQYIVIICSFIISICMFSLTIHFFATHQADCLCWSGWWHNELGKMWNPQSPCLNIVGCWQSSPWYEAEYEVAPHVDILANAGHTGGTGEVWNAILQPPADYEHIAMKILKKHQLAEDAGAGGFSAAGKKFFKNRTCELSPDAAIYGYYS